MSDTPLEPYARKIDPTKRPPLKPDGTPDINDRTEIGPTTLAFSEWAAAGLTPPNLDEMRLYRLRRVQEQLRKKDYAGILLWDPVNIRYATDAANMQIWTSRDHTRACFIATDGPVILFDLPACHHVLAHLPTVDEIRPVTAFYYWETGDRAPEFAESFAREIDALMRTHGGSNRRIAVDLMELEGIRAFDRLGLDIRNGQEIIAHARVVKDVNEVRAMRCAIHTCTNAMDAMYEAMRPGITENDMWAVLQAENIRRGGEWIETRLLSSGPRTNPWFQECGPRVIQDGDLVGFDTDLVGPYGYCVDISRTWLCGETRASNEQRHLYGLAREMVEKNKEILWPGMTFREVVDKSYVMPEEYVPQRYSGTHHGVGLCDEYPLILYKQDFYDFGYDGVIETGMVLSVEAYMGAVGGKNGVKLEDMIVMTEQGPEWLSNYPHCTPLSG